MVLLTIVLFLVLVFLLYYGYRTITNTKLIPDWVYFWRTKKEGDTAGSGDLSKPDPDTSALGYCDFEGEDLFSGDVYTFDGKTVPVDVSPILCSQCNQFVYKNDDGCVSYIFDKLENTNIDDSGLIDKLCDPKHPERNATCIQPHGTCTPSMAPSKKCAF
jgi:hypothetical protein